MAAHARWLGGLLAAGIGLLAQPAAAQDLQNFKPATGTWNLLSVDTSRTAPAGRVVPTLWLNWGLNPLVRRDSGGAVVETIIEHYATADVLVTYGVTDWLELGLGLPVSYTDGEAIAVLGDSGVGLGDVRLLPKVRLPARLGGHVGLALAVPVSLATGDSSRGMGAGTAQLHPTAIADVVFGGATLTANLGYRYRADDVAIEALVLGDEVTYGAGLAVELGRTDWVALGELFGAAPANSLDSVNANPLEALLALRWFAPFGGVVTAGGGLGLINDYGSPDLRVVLGLGYFDQTPPVVDSDGDGLPDADDVCPKAPEDRDGFQDADGCPDLDNDLDGVPDARDACPNRPEDLDGFEDENGCPDPDNDQDGLLDANDHCPSAAEDMDGFEDTDGCPDPDNDQDGVLDGADRCPTEPETVNGYKDDDGCPDRKIEVKITQQRLEVLAPVFFDFDKDTIKAESLDVLDAVADALKTHPDIKIQVAGHTDTRGSDAYNDALSQARTEAVVRYLVQTGGVAADRLVPKGYGKRQPLVDPTTDGADAKNRRVEFVIIR